MLHSKLYKLRVEPRAASGLEHDTNAGTPFMVPAAMEKPKAGAGWKSLVIGPVLQCVEAATLGMPFEVWKTRMGRFRTEGTGEAFMNVYRQRGIGGFWAGTGAKMIESASKGAILMYAKEGISDAALASGMGAFPAGILAGAGGGICQTTIMGPCTFLVTGAVNGDASESSMQRARRVYAANGVKGFYPGGTAIAFRQATNWASRQGFTELVREQMKTIKYGSNKHKLTKMEEAQCGVVGGIMACWNHPFEVARIEMQTRGDQGQKAMSMVQVFRMIVAENGVKGLFTGIIPRVGLGIWQTLFMVTGAKIVRDAIE